MNALDAVKAIEKRFGKEAIAGNKVEVEFVSSGSIGLDLALGGGVPKGRIIEYMGWESSGKTTLALHLAAEVQKLGKKVAYVDVEQAIDIDYAEALGVDCGFGKPDSLFYLSQPDCGEDALEIIREFARADDMGLIVVDSVAALTPKAVIQGEAGDAKMGLLARLMSSMLPTLTGPAKKSGCIILFISQYRDKIGVIYGPSTTTTGGNALKFYASQRLEVTKCGQEKDGDEVTANKTRVTVKKNKVGSPAKKYEFLIEFGIGISKIDEIIDLGVNYSVISKKGSWYQYGDVKLGQGAAGVKAILQDNPELYEEIKTKIYQTLGL
jgi:recombination protein RecA